MNDAQQAPIVRSHQKDAHFRAHLRSLLREFADSLPGMKTWLKWTKEIDLGADLLYYSLTTLAGYQTLGEEYVNILQINLDGKGIPSKYKRALMIALEILVPYTLDRLASIIAQRLRKGGLMFGLPKRGLADFVDLTKNIANFLHKYHLALFYISGVFFSLAKRLLGIYYVQVRPTRGSRMSKSYHILGLLMLLQLSITSIHRLYKVWSFLGGQKRQQFNSWKFIKCFLLFSEENDNECELKACAKISTKQATVDSTQDCGLCQGNITNITGTNCGHLFCWECIVQWCETKPECPICRATVTPSKLIRLQNFI